MIMKDKGQKPENYQDSREGYIPVNQKIESLYTDTKQNPMGCYANFAIENWAATVCDQNPLNELFQPVIPAGNPLNSVLAVSGGVTH